MMKYEFYDGDGNLIGLRESPKGRAMLKDEAVTLHFKAQKVSSWKVIAVSPVNGGLQTVVVRPSDSPAAE